MNGLLKGQSWKGEISARMRKSVLAWMIISVMVINGFVPRSAEGKESLFVVLTAVAGNVLVDVFEECRDTLTEMSNNIVKDLYKFLKMGETGTDVPEKEGEKKGGMPVNTSSDNGIMSERKLSWETRGDAGAGGSPAMAEGKTEEELYRLYSNIKVYNGEEKVMGIVYFILFIITIRARKFGAGLLNSGVVKEYKTDLR